MINTIDVTLRDGGYKTNFHFPSKFLEKHVKEMAQTGIDWIEVGYRNGSSKPLQSAGTTAYCSNSYLRNLKASAVAAKLCVIGHPANLDTCDIDDLVSEGVAMLRICCTAATLSKAQDLIAYAKQRGLVVCANITKSSNLRLHQLLKIAEIVAEANVDVIYIADTNGSMQPRRVETFVRSLREETGCQVGFHAHDHLGLAMSNTLAAVASGAKFVDASVNGVGKGGGNLRLEAWASYLSKHEKNDYDVDRILSQLPILEKVISTGGTRDACMEIILAFHDLSMDDRGILGDAEFDIPQCFRKAQLLVEQRV